MTWVFIYFSLDSLKTVEGTCTQQRLWPDCAGNMHSAKTLVRLHGVKADLSRRWSLYCRFCHALDACPAGDQEVGGLTGPETFFHGIFSTVILSLVLVH